jgi:hypothetical protein
MNLKLGAFLLAPALVLACGCSSSMPGSSSYGAFRGTLTAVEGSAFPAVAHAAVEAMRSLGMKPMERDRDGFQSFIVGESSFGSVGQSHEVLVYVTRLSDTTTRLEMRIRGRRDEDRLRQIHAEIRKRLAAPPG